MSEEDSLFGMCTVSHCLVSLSQDVPSTISAGNKSLISSRSMRGAVALVEWGPVPLIVPHIKCQPILFSVSRVLTHFPAHLLPTTLKTPGFPGVNHLDSRQYAHLKIFGFIEASAMFVPLPGVFSF